MSYVTPIFIAIAAVICTLLGGLFALRFKDKLHLILGFSAGAVMGVALFDLIPEALALANQDYSFQTVLVWVAVGFVVFMVLDRLVSLHYHEDDDCENPGHRGVLAAGSLSFHSFIDGLGIGLAFRVSPLIGSVVAAAVLVHDFSDGINTVNVILKNKGNKDRAWQWLVVDAFAPIMGVLVSFFFTIPQPTLGVILAIFAGLFLYIGASDLVPESHHFHPSFLTTLMTILGMTVLYLAVRFAI